MKTEVFVAILSILLCVGTSVADGKLVESMIRDSNRCCKLGIRYRETRRKLSIASIVHEVSQNRGESTARF